MFDGCVVSNNWAIFNLVVPGLKGKAVAALYGERCGYASYAIIDNTYHIYENYVKHWVKCNKNNLYINVLNLAHCKSFSAKSQRSNRLVLYSFASLNQSSDHVFEQNTKVVLNLLTDKLIFQSFIGWHHYGVMLK